MAKKAVPSPEILRQLLRYEPETGKLFWRERPASFFASASRSQEHSAKVWNSAWAGKEAFTVSDQSNYKVGTIFLQRGILAHRVAWALMTGVWPMEQIDHINGNPSDNRWENLREVSSFENGRNQALSRLNKTGTAGVAQRKETGHWTATINTGGKAIHLGDYLSKEEAIAARYGAERALGFHPNHGKRLRLTTKRRYYTSSEKNEGDTGAGGNVSA